MEKSFLLNVFDNNYVLLYRKVELRKKTNRKANMTKRQTYIIALAITCCILVAIGMTLHFGRKASTPPAPTPKPNIVAKEKPQPKDTIKKVKPVVRKTDYTISGTLTDEEGNGVADVIVSDGYTCVKTDSTGRYKMKRDSLARFIYYSVPADCEVPTHSDTDRTACFYQAVKAKKKIYDFSLTRLPYGKERQYKMIVIGDPQVTNAISPYYDSPDDNPIKKSDVERFTTQTMRDIRQTIRDQKPSTPVYGLSMGDDVQYYGGYNPQLERQIREALGSSEMRLFSVIGNHDQDGKSLYKRKWEENFGPTDYSFDRGDEHYVCINNCFFTKGKAYYSPGELHASQMRWLKQDLALTPKNKKVILCYHIPFTFGNAPYRKAKPVGIESEKGHFTSSRLSSLLALLEPFEGGYELFCGHTHFACNHEIEYEGRHVMEHCHAAACGNIWQSNVNIYLRRHPPRRLLLQGHILESQQADDTLSCRNQLQSGIIRRRLEPAIKKACTDSQCVQCRQPLEDICHRRRQTISHAPHQQQGTGCLCHGLSPQVQRIGILLVRQQAEWLPHHEPPVLL